MAEDTIDRRPVVILALLAVAGAGFMFYMFPASETNEHPAFVPAPAIRAAPATEPSPTTEEDAAPEPFVEQERVRGKVTYDQFTNTLSVKDDFGEELARIELTNKTDVLDSSFDLENRLVLVDFKDGRRVEVPEEVWRGMPSSDRDRLLYDDPALIPPAPVKAPPR